MLPDYLLAVIHGNPGQGLLPQAAHPTTLQAQEVRMVSRASITFTRMGAEMPDTVLALNTVGKSRLLQRRQGAVERDTIHPLRARRGSDLFVIEGTPGPA